MSREKAQKAQKKNGQGFLNREIREIREIRGRGKSQSPNLINAVSDTFPPSAYFAYFAVKNPRPFFFRGQ